MIRFVRVRNQVCTLYSYFLLIGLTEFFRTYVKIICFIFWDRKSVVPGRQKMKNNKDT